jgi:hypothetical protein
MNQKFYTFMLLKFITMNLRNILRPLLPHVLIVILFVAISYAFFYPILLGKGLTQMDDTHARGVAHELAEYAKQHPGEHPLWTNSLFGGMPSYFITGVKSFNIFYYLQRYIRLYLPYTTVAILFLLLTGFYLLAVSLKINKYLSIGGAIGFAFASFNIMIIGVGHVTQAYAISFVPMVAAGILMIFNKNYFWGGLLAVFSLGMEISFGHPQITYYCFLTILLLFLVKFIYTIREKAYKHFIIVSCISGLSLLLGILPNITNLWTTYEYGKYTMRGGSVLTQKNVTEKSTGLEKSYALGWSYGISESFSVLVPEIKGAGVKGYKDNSNTAEELRKVGAQDPEKIAASLPAYWGDLPWTDATIYFGAIICFLFVFGLFVVKGAEKWWLLSASILSFVLAWGQNFPLVTDFFFYHFPGYNKFRTVEMAIVIANFTFPFLGFIGLKNLVENKISKEDTLKALKYTSIIVGGLLLIFILIPGWFFNFSSVNDNSLIQQLKESKWPGNLVDSLLSAMRDDRKSIMVSDAFRSLIFVTLAAGLLWLFISKKIKPVVFSVILALLILIDLWSVDRRNLNESSFVGRTEYQNQFVETTADAFILKDQDPDFRVLNLTQNIFNDAFTSYFHKSIGGYHGAKMRRYQDLIEGPLSHNLMALQMAFQNQPTVEKMDNTLKSLSVLNMLNTKYIIYSGQAEPIINTHALGSVWFVNEIKWVSNPDEEYAALNDFDPSRIAIIDNRFKKEFGTSELIQSDSSAKIKLLSYEPHHLVYESDCSKPQVAVFSEIYYEKGWDAFIDGKLTTYGRANYVLRTMAVPSGSHKIEFKFEPKSVSTGNKVAMISSILIILLMVGGSAFGLKEHFSKSENKG